MHPPVTASSRRCVLALFVAAGIAFAVAGCGGGSSSSGSSQTSGATASQSSSTPASRTSSSSSTASSSSSSSSASGASGAAASVAEGKQIFSSQGCAGCHILAAAHSNGTTGPNLDQLKPSYAQVVSQVQSGGGAMPSYSGQLSTTQIESVAKYVSSVAGS